MGYHIDLKSITIDEYKRKLESSFLIPSRMVLKDKIDERFNHFNSIGIKNVHELQLMLKSKSKQIELAKNPLFSEEYLTILFRELNSIQAKPNKLKEFIGISNDTINKLEKEGIKDTLKLFDRVRTVESRKELANKLGINENEILELTKLSDLSRIKWVGATFARVLYDAGFETLEKVSKANYEDLHKSIVKLNKEKNLYKGHIGLNDMKICVLAANDVPLEIEY
ncbi:MAG: DUF4332 domain-containing protein [Bacteroidales bacterium]|nr:MAG: DUF4332 domain-containing protein [Bacteroidales bacterium]